MLTNGPVKMYTDWGFCGPPLNVGDFIISTGPRARACYFVQTLRRSDKVRGRIHWTGVRWPRDEIPIDATVHTMTWYPRNRKKRT